MEKFAGLRTLVMLTGLLSLPAGAQTPSPLAAADALARPAENSPRPQLRTLKQAAQAALPRNAEALARWQAFREARQETGMTPSALPPALDLAAGAEPQALGENFALSDGAQPANETLSTFRQMIIDGFAAPGGARRQGKAALVAYFRLLDAAQNVALEAARAYLEVLRYRQQSLLAEENLIQRQATLEQIGKRAESSAGERIDVDPAGTRLAQADARLLAAYGGLHDATARYLRLVGEPPATAMQAPADLARTLPDTVDAAVLAAMKDNPALRASIENSRPGRRIAFVPRVEAAARGKDFGSDPDSGRIDDSRVELPMAYKFPDSGSDIPSRQLRERQAMAGAQREKTCRAVRQSLSIAYQDSLRLTEQLATVARQARLAEERRATYGEQFKGGQRALLDPLTIQDEYFDARRAQVDAEFELSVAHLRSHAGIGRLLETLDLKRVDADETHMPPLDPEPACPALVADKAPDRQPPGGSAAKTLDGSPDSPRGRPQPAADASAEAGVAGGRSQALEAEIYARTMAWGTAWAARDVGHYLRSYSIDFTPEGGVSLEDWARQRKQRLPKDRPIHLEISQLVVRSTSPGTALAQFRQVYRTSGFADTVDKTLEWRRENGEWQIVREVARPPGQTRSRR